MNGSRKQSELFGAKRDFSISDLGFTTHEVMTEPEIARRCPSCGVSIREPAFFCPQCGLGLTQNAEPPETSGAPALDQTIAEFAPTMTDEAAALPATVQLDEVPGGAQTVPLPAADETIAIQHEPRSEATAAAGSDSPQAESPGVSAAATAKPVSAMGAVGAKVHRAATIAREVEGDVVHRVKRVREMSSVVLDEAAFDPSLRFVLVAAVLFLLFLLVVLLNKVIT